jgi:hypothetical protein
VPIQTIIVMDNGRGDLCLLVTQAKLQSAARMYQHADYSARSSGLLSAALSRRQAQRLEKSIDVVLSKCRLVTHNVERICAPTNNEHSCDKSNSTILDSYLNTLVATMLYVGATPFR